MPGIDNNALTVEALFVTISALHNMMKPLFTADVIKSYFCNKI
jgi:hypothetical protein